MSIVKYKNVQAEAEILSGILSDDDLLSEIIDIITPDHFTLKTHQQMYVAAVSIYTKGNKVVLNNLLVEMNSMNKDYDKKEFSNAIASFAGKVSSRESVKLVIEAKNKNTLFESLKHSIEMLDAKEALEVADAITETSDLLYSRDNKDHLITDESSIIEVMDELNTTMSTKKPIGGIMTGWKEIDLCTSGFQSGQLIIIGARPSVGKSAFALNLNERLNRKGHKGVIFSLEMASKQLMYRRIGIGTQYKIRKYKYGDMNEGEMQKFSQVVNGIATNNMTFTYDKGAITIDEIRRTTKKAKYKYNIDYIIVDHINIIQGKTSQKRIEVVTEASARLKAIAKEFDITVFALSQLSRTSEHSSDKKPMLHHLRESGSIEQDADMVILLHRDKDNEEGEVVNLDVDIAKNRDGKTGLIKFDFDLGKQYIDERWF